MKLVRIFTLCLITSLVSCSFKKSEETHKDKQVQNLIIALDSDGDGKTDQEEINSGEHPF